MLTVEVNLKAVVTYVSNVQYLLCLSMSRNCYKTRNRKNMELLDMVCQPIQA